MRIVYSVLCCFSFPLPSAFACSRCCLHVRVLVLTYIHPDCLRAVSLMHIANTIFHIMRTPSNSLEIFFLLASKKKNSLKKKEVFISEWKIWAKKRKKERYTRTNTLLQIPFSFFNGCENKKYFSKSECESDGSFFEILNSYFSSRFATLKKYFISFN